MNLSDFKATLSNDQAPTGLSPALESLWVAGKGDWDGAHTIVQGYEGQQNPDWVHAFLHRQEGDIPNANYWYRRAGRTMPSTSLEQEWDDIASALLM